MKTYVVLSMEGDRVEEVYDTDELESLKRILRNRPIHLYLDPKPKSHKLRPGLKIGEDILEELEKVF